VSSSTTFGSGRIDPALTIANLKQWFPLRRPDQSERLSKGLRLAGLPVQVQHR
jgi:hypothetical protein